MGDGHEVDEGMKCDYCEKDAVLKFRLMRLVRGKGGRWARIASGMWLAGCQDHVSKAMDKAQAGIKR